MLIVSSGAASKQYHLCLGPGDLLGYYVLTKNINASCKFTKLLLGETEKLTVSATNPNKWLWESYSYDQTPSEDFKVFLELCPPSSKAYYKRTALADNCKEAKNAIQKALDALTKKAVEDEQSKKTAGNPNSSTEEPRTPSLSTPAMFTAAKKEAAAPVSNLTDLLSRLKIKCLDVNKQPDNSYVIIFKKKHKNRVSNLIAQLGGASIKYLPKKPGTNNKRNPIKYTTTLRDDQCQELIADFNRQQPKSMRNGFDC